MKLPSGTTANLGRFVFSMAIIGLLVSSVMTQQIFAAPPPPKVYNMTISADSPNIANGSDTTNIEVFATDRKGNPVSSAVLNIIATSNGAGFRDEVNVLAVTNIGGGRYTAAFSTFAAGEYAIRATDSKTGKFAETLVVFLPGPLASLDVAFIQGPFPEPLGGRGYDVGVRPIDQYGNPIGGVSFDNSTDLGSITLDSFDPVSQLTYFKHSYDGYGIANVTLTGDASVESNLSLPYLASSLVVARDSSLLPDHVGDSIGVENATDFSVSLSLFHANSTSSVGAYSAIINYNTTSFQFNNITDPNPSDQFSPEAHELTPGNITIFSEAVSPESIQNIQAATIQFSSIGEGGQTGVIKIIENEILDETLIPITITTTELPAITIVAKPKVEIPVTIWIVQGSATPTEAADDVAKANQVFKDLADKCICDKYINAKIVGLNIIKPSQWRDIDKDKDGNLDTEETGNLPRASGDSTNIYYVSGLHDDGTALAGASYGNTNTVAVDDSADLDDLTLAHELAHAWSDGAIEDPTGPNAAAQGATTPGNLMNYDSTGVNLTATQCDLIKYTQ